MVERATCYCPASSYILLIAQRERIYILTDARCVSLGFMWLEVKVDEEKKNKQTNKVSLITFSSENEISNSVEVFLSFVLFHYYFFTKNLMVPGVPRSADPDF